MSICKLSNEYLSEGFTLLDNLFINDFLPFAKEDELKVYCYGLMICKSGIDNFNLEKFSLKLGIEPNLIIKAVEYWQEQGIMRILSKEPFAFEYLPIREQSNKVKKYKPEKYSNFNQQLQFLFPEHIFTPNELLKFYDVIEEYQLAPDAMIMIASYCIHIKGGNLHFNYILTVAKCWASEGATTIDAVENKLKEYESYNDSLRKIYYTLGLKSTPDFEDKQLLIKWQASWGYDLDSILYSAKLCKKRGGMKKLDSLIDNFYRLGMFNLNDITEHAKYIEETRSLAIQVNKTIGVFYENVDYIVECYITDWLNKGFDSNSILTLAKYCFTKSIKSLEGLNNIIEKFYKEGLVSVSAINQYIDRAVATDAVIKSIIIETGSSRMVKPNDRDFYNTWSNLWGFNNEIISYCASLAHGKSHPFAYMNQLLAKWKEEKLTTVEECKNYSPTFTQPKVSTQDFENARNYTQEELNSIFGDTSDIKNLESL